MKFANWVSLALLVGPLVSASQALVHGGGYTPPPPPPVGGTNPGPGDSVPNGPITPGAGGGLSGPSTPAAPGPSSPSTPRPNSPTAPAPATPRAPSSPAGVVIADWSDWSWWWNFNRDPYLDLRHKVLSSGALTDGGEFDLGQGQTASRTSLAPDEEMIRTEIGPALQAATENGSWRVKSDAMLAIAKLRPEFIPVRVSLIELITQHLSASNQKLSESAVVALGLMGGSDAAQILSDIASDNVAGRKWVGRSSVPGRTRPLAVLALGVLGKQLDSEYERLRLVNSLQAFLEQPRGAYADMHVACVTAMGMTALSERGPVGVIDASEGEIVISGRAAQVRYLLTILQDEERNEYVRAHVPKALAMLARDSSVELRDATKQALLAELERRKRSDRLVSYGVVEALGVLGDADVGGVDAQVREALHASVVNGNNSQRGVSLVAIALASSRRGEGEQPFAALDGERGFLLKQLATGKSRQRPWSALALGLQQYHASEAGLPQSKEVLQALLESNAKVRAPGDSGAWSIALGLFGDLVAEEALTNRMQNSADDNARGYAAIGLGLMDATGSSPALERLIDKSRFRPIPLRKSSEALVLLRRKNVVTILLSIIDEEQTASVKASCLAALGLVGDRRAVDPIVAILEDDEQLDMTRSFAAIALGVTCEPGGLPWTADLSNHVNYFALSETLLTSKGTGILNLR